MRHKPYPNVFESWILNPYPEFLSWMYLSVYCHMNVFVCLLSHACICLSIVTCMHLSVYCHMHAFVCLLSHGCICQFIVTCMHSSVYCHVHPFVSLLSRACICLSIVTCMHLPVDCHVHAFVTLMFFFINLTFPVTKSRQLSEQHIQLFPEGGLITG